MARFGAIMTKWPFLSNMNLTNRPRLFKCPMDLPQDPLLDAAIAVLARHGVRKATMADIAQAADVSRQTLYGRYGDKDGIICAVMTYMTDRSLAQIRADWAGLNSLSDQLWAFFQHSTIAYYALVQRSPDAEDIISGANPAALAANRQAETRKTALLAELLAPYEPQLLMRQESAWRLAGFIAASCGGLKYSAESETQLIHRLETLRSAILAMTGETAADRP